MLAGLSIIPLVTYLVQLGYTGLFSRDLMVKLGSFLPPLGTRTHSEGETLELLLTTHFPDSEVTHELMSPRPTSWLDVRT